MRENPCADGKRTKRLWKCFKGLLVAERPWKSARHNVPGVLPATTRVLKGRWKAASMPVIEVNNLTKAYRTYKKQPGFSGDFPCARSNYEQIYEHEYDHHAHR
jgi:hypothetical protein